MKIAGTLGDRAGAGALKQALHAYALRQRATASNIANAEVPGYRAQRVEFEDFMRRALGPVTPVEGARTHPGHLPLGAPPSGTARVVEEAPADAAAGVDLEREMVDLVESQLAYRLAVRLLDMRYNQLHAAIRGSSR
jgi:flagellar basal-body rod protein FlgB